jgi:Fe2+ transport system protein FeoA
LISLGLFKGSTIEILKNDFSGPLILAFKSTRISIGRKIAEKIKIEAT